MILDTHVCIAGQIHRQIYQISFFLLEPARVTNVRIGQSMWYHSYTRVRVGVTGSEYQDQGRIRVRYNKIRSGQVRSGQFKARPGQARSGQVRSSQVKSSQVRSVQVSSGHGRASKAVQVRSGHVRPGQVNEQWSTAPSH